MVNRITQVQIYQKFTKISNAPCELPNSMWLSYFMNHNRVKFSIACKNFNIDKHFIKFQASSFYSFFPSYSASLLQRLTPWYLIPVGHPKYCSVDRPLQSWILNSLLRHIDTRTPTRVNIRARALTRHMNQRISAEVQSSLGCCYSICP